MTSQPLRRILWERFKDYLATLQYARLLRLAASVVAWGFAFFFFQRFLQNLSGSALWVPESWRQAVNTLGFLVGGIVFGIARLVPVSSGHSHAPAEVGERGTPAALSPKSGVSPSHSRDECGSAKTPTPGSKAGPVEHHEEKHKGPASAIEDPEDEQQEEARHHYVRHRRALSLALLAALGLGGFMVLHEVCVISVDLRAWSDEEQVALPTAAAAKAPKVEPPAAASEERHGEAGNAVHEAPPQPSRTSTASHGGHGDRPEPMKYADGTLVPNYVDPVKNELFMPLWFSPTIKSLAEAEVRSGRSVDGVSGQLTHNTQQFIDALGSTCRLQYGVTIALFFMLYLLVLGFASGAFGYAVSAMDAAIEEYVHGSIQIPPVM